MKGKERKQSARSEAFGCLASIAGAMVGFAAGFLWSRSQVHFLGNFPLRGESHAKMVFSHAMLGALAGVILVSAVGYYLRKRRERRERQRAEEAPPREP